LFSSSENPASSDFDLTSPDDDDDDDGDGDVGGSLSSADDVYMYNRDIAKFHYTGPTGPDRTFVAIYIGYLLVSWWRGAVVERRSLVGELSLSCARPAADG